MVIVLKHTAIYKNLKINTTLDLLKTYNKYNNKLDTLINNNLDIHNYTNKNTDIVSDSTKYIDSIQTIHHKKDANIFVTDGFTPQTVIVTASGGKYYINNQQSPQLKILLLEELIYLNYLIIVRLTSIFNKHITKWTNCYN